MKEVRDENGDIVPLWGRALLAAVILDLESQEKAALQGHIQQLYGKDGPVMPVERIVGRRTRPGEPCSQEFMDKLNKSLEEKGYIKTAGNGDYEVVIDRILRDAAKRQREMDERFPYPGSYPAREIILQGEDGI